MVLKCRKCGAPLEGIAFKTIGRLFGLGPSENDPELCNKCEAKEKIEEEPEDPLSEIEEENDTME